MNKRSRRKQGADKSKSRLAGRRKPMHLITLLLVFGALVAGGFFLLHGKHTGAQSSPPAAIKESVPTTQAPVDFNHLKGRWLRPDGGYVLEIRDINDSGKMTAAYFNPRPINVSQAEAELDRAIVKVFVELRDVNYPGATYHLTYDAEKDQLRGVYFQPALRQSFDVFFSRLK